VACVPETRKKRPPGFRKKDVLDKLARAPCAARVGRIAHDNIGGGGRDSRAATSPIIFP